MYHGSGLLEVSEVLRDPLELEGAVGAVDEHELLVVRLGSDGT